MLPPSFTLYGSTIYYFVLSLTLNHIRSCLEKAKGRESSFKFHVSQILFKLLFTNFSLKVLFNKFGLPNSDLNEVNWESLTRGERARGQGFEKFFS